MAALISLVATVIIVVICYSSGNTIAGNEWWIIVVSILGTIGVWIATGGFARRTTA